MRHLVKGRKLGRTTAHRTAMLRNLVTSFLEKERVRTTLAKAKEARPLAEKMITLAKRGSLHDRRRALGFVRKESGQKAV
jgi:large subunit ribosomal protein L17